MANNLTFSIFGDDRTGKAFAGVQANLKSTMGVVSETQRKMTAFGKKASLVGGAMSLGMTTPLLAAAKDIANVAGGFESSMNRVQALSGATGEEFKALRAQAKELGATTSFSATQAADAMGFLAMAGFDAEQTLGAMPGTLQLAASAQMDLADTADIVSNVLTGFRKPVSDLADVNDVLVKTMTSTNTDLRMLGDAFKYVGPVASAAGADFNEIAAAIGLLGNAGIQGEMGGTALRGAMTKILNPTKAARGVMDELGLSLTDTAGNLKPLADILDELAPHADDAGVFMELFGQRAGPAMLALVNQGSGALRGLTAELDNAGGTADRIAKAQMKGFNGSMKAMSSAFEGLKIAIADSGMLDILTDIVKGVTRVIASVAEADPALLKMGTAIAAVAAVLGPLVMAGGAIAMFVGALSAPVVGVIAVIGLVIAAFVAFGDEIMYAAEVVGGAMLDIGEGILNAITFIPRQIMKLGVMIIDGLIEGITGEADVVKNAITGIADSIIGWFKDVLGISSPSRIFMEFGEFLLQGLVDGIMAYTDFVRDTIQNVGGAVIGWFKEKLGISSPSKVFAELGGFIMQGLAGGIDENREIVKKSMAGTADDVVAEAGRATEGIQGALGSVKESITGTLRGALQTGKLDFSSFADSLKSMATRLKDSLIDGMMKPIEDGLSKLFGGIGVGPGGGIGGGIGGGLFGSLLGGVGKLFAGFFADGGTIPAGKFGIVGERGPEFAFAGTGGMTIQPIPTRGGMPGGGIYVDQRVSITGLGIDDVERRLAPRLEQQRRQTLADVNQAWRDNADFLA